MGFGIWYWAFSEQNELFYALPFPHLFFELKNLADQRCTWWITLHLETKFCLQVSILLNCGTHCLCHRERACKIWGTPASSILCYSAWHTLSLWQHTWKVESIKIPVSHSTVCACLFFSRLRHPDLLRWGGCITLYPVSDLSLQEDCLLINCMYVCCRDLFLDLGASCWN